MEQAIEIFLMWMVGVILGVSNPRIKEPLTPSLLLSSPSPFSCTPQATSCVLPHIWVWKMALRKRKVLIKGMGALAALAGAGQNFCLRWKLTQNLTSKGNTQLRTTPLPSHLWKTLRASLVVAFSFLCPLSSPTPMAPHSSDMGLSVSSAMELRATEFIGTQRSTTASLLKLQSLCLPSSGRHLPTSLCPGWAAGGKDWGSHPNVSSLRSRDEFCKA